MSNEDKQVEIGKKAKELMTMMGSEYYQLKIHTFNCDSIMAQLSQLNEEAASLKKVVPITGDQNGVSKENGTDIGPDIA